MSRPSGSVISRGRMKGKRSEGADIESDVKMTSNPVSPSQPVENGVVRKKKKPGRTAQAFIEAYCGPANESIAEACRLVGISQSAGYAHSVRWRAEINAYKNGELAISDVADVQELKRFFTLALRDPDIAFKDRLMAAQTLAKINGLMNDKFEMRTNRREAVRELHELVMRLANSVKPSNSNSK